VAEPGDLDHGTAGASARREHARRAASREERARRRHPHIGGLLLAMQDAPQHQEAWARGAAGEERVARSLAKLVAPSVILLHDRGIPGSRANIDHIAVAPGGIWVIDAKRYRGKIAVERPWIGQAKLKIAGRDRTNLITALKGQVALVQAAFGAADGGAVPVHGALCFVDTDLPWLRTIKFDGCELLYPRALSKRLNAPGALTTERVHALARALATRFPVA
jgi:Nuclease-related domain